MSKAKTEARIDVQTELRILKPKKGEIASYKTLVEGSERDMYLLAQALRSTRVFNIRFLRYCKGSEQAEDGTEVGKMDRNVSEDALNVLQANWDKVSETLGENCKTFEATRDLIKQGGIKREKGIATVETVEQPALLSGKGLVSALETSEEIVTAKVWSMISVERITAIQTAIADSKTVRERAEAIRSKISELQGELDSL